MTDKIPDTEPIPDPDEASIPDQFMAGETIVEGYASGCPGTGKTTQLVEWFRAQHGDDAVLTLVDPTGEASTESIEMIQSTPLSVRPRHTTHKYSVTGEHRTATDEEAPS